MPPLVDGQAFNCRDPQPAATLHSHLPSASSLWKARVRGIEARASAPHNGELLQVVHPKVAASITANTHPFSLGKTLCLAEVCNLPSCHPAKAGAASVPQDTGLQENSVCVRPVCTHRRGEPAKRKSATFLWSCGYDEATDCTDKSSARAVKQNCTIAVYSAARERHFFKVIALLLEEARPVSCQEAAIRRLAETQDHVVGKTLTWPITLKPLAIVAE